MHSLFISVSRKHHGECREWKLVAPPQPAGTSPTWCLSTMSVPAQASEAEHTAGPARSAAIGLVDPAGQGRQEVPRLAGAQHGYRGLSCSPSNFSGLEQEGPLLVLFSANNGGASLPAQCLCTPSINMDPASQGVSSILQVDSLPWGGGLCPTGWGFCPTGDVHPYSWPFP